MSLMIAALEAEQMIPDRKNFRIGDTVKVHYQIVEGKTERIQIYEGIVISSNHGGIRETFTVRKISFGIGVERIFPLHSPNIAKIQVARKAKVRRAKLYYLRQRSGKAARVKERIVSNGKQQNSSKI